MQSHVVDLKEASKWIQSQLYMMKITPSKQFHSIDIFWVKTGVQCCHFNWCLTLLIDACPKYYEIENSLIVKQENDFTSLNITFIQLKIFTTKICL